GLFLVGLALSVSGTENRSEFAGAFWFGAVIKFHDAVLNRHDEFCVLEVFERVLNALATEATDSSQRRANISYHITCLHLSCGFVFLIENMVVLKSSVVVC